MGGILAGGSLHRQQQEQKEAASNLSGSYSASTPSTPVNPNPPRSPLGSNHPAASVPALSGFGSGTSVGSSNSPSTSRSNRNEYSTSQSRDHPSREDASTRSFSGPVGKKGGSAFSSRSQEARTTEVNAPDPRFAPPASSVPSKAATQEEEASRRENNRPYSLNIGSNRSLSSSSGLTTSTTTNGNSTSGTSPRWSSSAFESATRSSSNVSTSAALKKSNRPSTSPYGNSEGAASSSSLIKLQRPPSRKASMESLRGLTRFGSRSSRRKNSLTNGSDSESENIQGHPPSSSRTTPTQEKSNPLWGTFKKENSSTGSLIKPGPKSWTSEFSPSRNGTNGKGESSTSSSLNNSPSPSHNLQGSTGGAPYTDPIHQDSRFPNPQFPPMDRTTSDNQATSKSASGSRPGSSSGARAAAGLRATKAGFKNIFGKRDSNTKTPPPQAAIESYTHGIPIFTNKQSDRQGSSLGPTSRDQNSVIAGNSDFGHGQSYQSQNGTFGSQGSGLGLGASYSSSSSRDQARDTSFPPHQFSEERRESKASESSYASSASFSYHERDSVQGPPHSHLSPGREGAGDDDVAPTIDFDLPSPGFSFSSPLGGKELQLESDPSTSSSSSSPSKSRGGSAGPSGDRSEAGKATEQEGEKSEDSPYTKTLLLDPDMSAFSRFYGGVTSLDDASSKGQGEDEIKSLLKKKLQDEQAEKEARMRDASTAINQRDSMDSAELGRLRENHESWSALLASEGDTTAQSSVSRAEKSLPPTPSTASPVTQVAGGKGISESIARSTSALGLEAGPILSPSASSFRGSVRSEDMSNGSALGHRSSAGEAERLDDSSSSSHFSSNTSNPDGTRLSDFSGVGSRDGTPQPQNNPDSVSTPPSTSGASLSRELRTPTPESKGSMESSRPSIPVKSKDRPAPLQPDPATLARLENGTPLPPTASPIPPLFQLPDSGFENRQEPNDTSAPNPIAASPTSAAIKRIDLPGGVDPATYVPLGALSRTRKGVALSSPGQSQKALSGRDRSSSVASQKSARGLASPRIQSRFSIASTDTSRAGTPANTEGWEDPSSPSARSLSLDEEADPASSSANDGQMLPASAWVEVEGALRRFKDSAPGVDKGSLLRSVVLPFLALEAETPNVEVSGSGIFKSSKSRRNLFFDWIRNLLLELQHVQTSADRGAILESIACIIESRNFSNKILKGDGEDLAKFNSVFGHILSYAIGELNKKGVYQNTLIFSGRLLGE